MRRAIYRFIHWASCSLLLILLSSIPVRLAIAQYQNPQPEMILMLGGQPEREVFTAQFSQSHPKLNIWLSTGSPEASHIFQTAGVSRSRIYFDCRATDTVTNFTTVVDDFKHLGIQHIYLVTSAFHMPRAKAIATIVLGSQGIAFTPVVVPDVVPAIYPPESKLRVLRDVGRSLVWMGTGRTGARLNRRFLQCS
jgi:uncharacterized SAM-binding protein YcdF (DUF218 family)